MNTYYDCSAYNIDALDGLVENNSAVCVPSPGINDYKMETGFEIHMPKGIVRGNIAENFVNGFLFLGWNNYIAYQEGYNRNLLIENNKTRGSIRAIALWGDYLYANRLLANMRILNNDLQLSLDKYGTNNMYYNISGHIVCINAGADKGIFKDIEIAGNDMTVVSPFGWGIDLWSYRTYIEQGGGINLCSNNKCVGWRIHDNRIQYPYSVFKIMTYDVANYHEDIEIKNNILTDCARFRMYDDKQPPRGFDGVYVVENARNVSANGDKITGILPVGYIKKGINTQNINISYLA